MPYQGSKRLQSTFSKLLNNYKSNKRYGYLSSGLLMVWLIGGQKFFNKLEASGLLLCGEHVESKFYTMLKRLKYSTKAIANGADWFDTRFDTYISYCHLVERNIETISRLEHLLLNRSTCLIKALLGLTELYFITYYFDHDLEIGLPILARIRCISRTPEEFASIASHLIWMANSFKPLTEEEFQTEIDNELRSSNIAEVINGGEILKCMSDVGKAISVFGYSLKVICKGKKIIYKMNPPSTDFEYFLRLGHIREEIMRPTDQIHAYNRFDCPLLSMNVATKYLIDKFSDFFTKWIDKPFPRVTIKLHSDSEEDIYKGILKEQTYLEDIYHSQHIHDEYLINEQGEDIFIDDVLDLNNFMHIYRHLLFFNYLDINAIILYKQKYNRFSMNSFVRVAESKGYIKNMAKLFFINEKHLERFLMLLTWDAKNGYYCDLQYQPLIRVNRLTVILPSLFTVSNIFRNVQVSNKIRVKQRGTNFTMLCRKLLEKHFHKVISEKRLKHIQKGLRSEIDVIAWHGQTLYLFECKYSLPSCNYQEMRDIWDDILKGVDQLNVAKQILSDPEKRLSYLTGWFPGTTSHETENIEIKVCLISSHRMFSGMSIDGIPIRDFYSFEAIMTEGVMSHGVIEPEKENILIQYSSVSNGAFSKADIDDYLDRKSRYFKMFSDDMLPVTNFRSLNNNRFTLAWETFLYSYTGDTSMESYTKRMDSLGFYRLPDKKIVVNFPISVENFEKHIHNSKDQR
jgi:hypothetical protein